MDEYIKRGDAIREAIEAVDEYDGGYVTSRDDMIAIYINAVPSADVVEVVHCKDCIHRPIIGGSSDWAPINPPKDKSGLNDYTCPGLCLDPYYNFFPANDFFCAYGEKDSAVPAQI